MKQFPQNLLLCLFASIAFLSCQNDRSEKQSNQQQSTTLSKEEVEQNLPVYNDIVITKQWGNCDNYPQEGCLDVSIQYPSFDHIEDEELKTSLEDQVLEYVADFLTTELPINEKELQPFIEKSLAAKQQEFEASTKQYADILQLTVNFETIYQNETITTIKSEYTSYQGGAHPNHGAGFHIFNNNTGKQLEHGDIVAKDMELKQTMLSELKAKQGMPNSDISEIGYLITDLEFAVSDNIGVTADSLFLTYSPYEIAPYSMGFQNFSYAKNEVENTLRKDFLKMWNTSE